MHLALSYPPADDDQDMSSAVMGLVTHLDTVYGFALTLTGDREAAVELTEDVYVCARDELWGTLGGHGLRDRLLARCVSSFVERGSTYGPEAPATSPAGRRQPTRLRTLLHQLPWDERAAIALVDQLRSSYEAAAAVLGVDVAEFRALLHRGRTVLFAAYRVGAR